VAAPRVSVAEVAARVGSGWIRGVNGGGGFGSERTSRFRAFCWLRKADSGLGALDRAAAAAPSGGKC
jgi:hypothetical protein